MGINIEQYSEWYDNIQPYGIFNEEDADLYFRSFIYDNEEIRITLTKKVFSEGKYSLDNIIRFSEEIKDINSLLNIDVTELKNITKDHFIINRDFINFDVLVNIRTILNNIKFDEFLSDTFSLNVIRSSKVNSDFYLNFCKLFLNSISRKEKFDIYENLVKNISYRGNNKKSLKHYLSSVMSSCFIYCLVDSIKQGVLYDGNNPYHISFVDSFALVEKEKEKIELEISNIYKLYKIFIEDKSLPSISIIDDYSHKYFIDKLEGHFDSNLLSLLNPI